jgi:hypothetical protein
LLPGLPPLDREDRGSEMQALTTARPEPDEMGRAGSAFAAPQVSDSVVVCVETLRAASASVLLSRRTPATLASMNLRPCP